MNTIQRDLVSLGLFLVTTTPVTPRTVLVRSCSQHISSLWASALRLGQKGLVAKDKCLSMTRNQNDLVASVKRDMFTGKRLIPATENIPQDLVEPVSS
jgi:hypothetical protein